MTMRNAILGVAGMVLAVLAAWHSGLAYYRAHALSAVPGIFADDPLIMLQRGQAALFVEGPRRPDATGLERAAASVLRRDPLESGALYALGAAQVLKGTGDGFDKFLLADKVSRRHAPTELALMVGYARRNDLPGVIRSFDRAMTVSPALMPAVGPRIVDLLGDDRVVQAMAPLAHRLWFLSFVDIAFDRQAPPAAIDLLLTSAARLQPNDVSARKLLLDQRVRLLRTILTQGNYPLAQQTLRRLPKVQRDALERLDFLPANTSADMAPLAWTLANDSVKSAELQGNGTLLITIRAEQTGIAADRMTLLSAGEYEVTQRLSYRDSDSKVALLWDVVCEGPSGQAIWHQAVPTRSGRVTYRSTISIPAGCPLQHWFLKGLGALGQAESTATLEHLSIVGK